MVIVIGVVFCMLLIDGVGYLKVFGYFDVLCDDKVVGNFVVIVGVGGIGFDVVEYFVYCDCGEYGDVDWFFSEWGVD